MQMLLTILGQARATMSWFRARLAGARIPRAARRRLLPIDMARGAHLTALALSAGLALLAARPVRADHDYRWRDPDRNVRYAADGSLVDVQVMVDGLNAPLYFRPNGSDRFYFQAFKGRNYSLVVRNNTARRVGVLIAVDGLNVVTGERSSLSRNESMYVLDPYERAVIRGWRTSLDQVRRFVFVDEERSYAERTGQANGDLGWIRVLSFREVEPYGWWDRWGRGRSLYRDDAREERREAPEAGAPAPELQKAPSEAPNVAPKASDGLADRRSPNGTEGESAPGLEQAPGAPESNPGTGWGSRRYDPVRRTQFTAERSATDHIVLRYEYADGLRALGIIPRRWRLWDREDGELGFAQPPRW
jgi:hypothetical protein